MTNNEYIATVDDNNEVHLTDTQIIRCKDYSVIDLESSNYKWLDIDSDLPIEHEKE